ncbi:ABC transporter A family member 6 [Lathyrus oleraceus]|nr:ABC transporter A family member 6-like [Pisum sativum]
MTISSTFSTQANALLRKNLTFQKRNNKTNIRLILFPFILCVFLFLLQPLIDNQFDKPQFKCGCGCINNTTTCSDSEKLCGIQYSDQNQVLACAIPSPPEWPPLLQLPPGKPWYPPVYTMLFTAENHSFGQIVSDNMFPTVLTMDYSDIMASLASNMLGSEAKPESNNFLEPAFTSDLPIYYVQTKCPQDDLLFPPIYSVGGIDAQQYMETFPFTIAGFHVDIEIGCADGINLWRNSSSEINNELYEGHERSSPQRINPIFSAFDFLNSNENGFNATVWYKSTYKDVTNFGPTALLRIPRSVNLISNAYLQFLRGPGTKMLFEFVKEMPKSETPFRIEIASLLGGLFFTWVVLQLFPVSAEISKEIYQHEIHCVIREFNRTERTVLTLYCRIDNYWPILKFEIAVIFLPMSKSAIYVCKHDVVLTSLVYEKQQKLRIMMKMHGLGDGPYWMITYGYFLALSVIYMLCFVTFGSVLGLKFFTLNDYSIQFVFYFIYINLQITLAFLLASFFSSVKTATVTAYIGIFGTGLLSGFLFQFFIQDSSFPRGWIIFMELYPGFALYRGLYEFAQSATSGSNVGTDGMRWHDLSDSANGMKEVLIIMFAEWIVVLFVAYYIDQVFSTGSGKRPLFFLKGFQKKPLSSCKTLSIQRQGSKVLVQMEKPDVMQEREKVEQLLLEPTIDHAIVCDNLKKFYPGRDGNPGKFAVRELSLAVPRGECFGMLGPNGAGKTSFISMMIGLTKPTSGAAYVQGLDIKTHMDGIYTSMGV